MSCGGGGEKEGRGSRRPSPLRAILPVQAMHRTSPLRLRNRISPDTEITPGLDLLSTATPTKGRGSRCGRGSQSGGEGGSGGGGGGGVLMRRTASLDTIYLKGPCWHKDQQQQQQQTFTQFLHVDKASQTPEEWVSVCYGGVSLGCTAALEETALSPCGGNSNSSSNNSNSRRPSVSVVSPSSPWLAGGNTANSSSSSSSNHHHHHHHHNNPAPPPPPPSGEQLDKFIRHRLQRTNKEGSSSGGSGGGGGIGGGGGGLRYSPIHADHSVLTPTLRQQQQQQQQQQHALQQTNGGSRAISIPQLPKPLLPPRLRSSVEGLNQEIERLVLRPASHMSGDELEDVWSEICRDGRRAPIAEYLRFTRSVDTQTPARGSAVSTTSSDHTSPSLSPPTSPPHVLGPEGAAMPSSTPSPTTTTTTTTHHPLATSPHINKFLAREPPDGCERVALKHHEDRSGVSRTSEWPAVRPPGGFTLRASQGSAFCAPERIVPDEAVCGATSLPPCDHQTDPGSVYCPVCAVESSDSPEPELAQCLPPELAQCLPPDTTMTHHPLTCDVGVSTTTTTTTTELTADQ